MKKIINSELIDNSAKSAFWLTLSFLPFILLIISLIPVLPINNEDFINNILIITPSSLDGFLTSLITEILDNINYSVISISFVLSIWSSSTFTNDILKSLSNNEKSLITQRLYALLFNFIMIFFLILNFILFPWISTSIKLFILSFILIYILYSFSIKASYKNILLGSLSFIIFGFLAIFFFEIYITNFSSYTAIYGFIGTFIIILLEFFLICLSILLGGNIIKYMDDK